MIVSRPVALVRGILVVASVWGLGAAATFALFRYFGASTTIADVSGQPQRVQIIWWGAHAFCACVGGVLGVSLGGTALTQARIERPMRATVLLAVPALLGGVAVLAGLTLAGVLSVSLAAACAAGLLTGVVAGGIYVLQNGMPDDVSGFYPLPRRAAGQSWGSR